MTFQLRIQRQAREDIRSARDWYDEQSPGLGGRLGDELDAVMASIGERPLLYPVIYRNVHRAMARRFPYAHRRG
jgi:plasmid stabilization system protein ParE